jgi:hypothetical protein
VFAALAPIKTGKCKAARLAPDARDVDAEFRKRLFTSPSDDVAAVHAAQKPTSDQGAGQLNSKPPGEVVVARAAFAQLLSFGCLA